MTSMLDTDSTSTSTTQASIPDTEALSVSNAWFLGSPAPRPDFVARASTGAPRPKSPKLFLFALLSSHKESRERIRAATKLLESAPTRLGLSERANDRILKVARTIGGLGRCGVGGSKTPERGDPGPHAGQVVQAVISGLKVSGR